MSHLHQTGTSLNILSIFLAWDTFSGLMNRNLSLVLYPGVVSTTGIHRSRSKHLLNSKLRGMQTQSLPGSLDSAVGQLAKVLANAF